ncbi:hypothetical protein Sgly_1803 [Syntrophobotulus glycolicus DSM 8271]|uniref:Coat F domain protein n=1 Tax=Syntrophobotulus glycolicus (strain DSM 8271 / FlGlyR) TaxID=645991 RepID=F0SZL4_SYNGF|nr:hypothetical protein Sgly_1803 [Syntrophobotulus glycolicus DSM 8271]
MKYTDVDMLYDYEKDVAAAASGYITLATRVADEHLRDKYFKLANEAGKVHSKVSRLIEKRGGIS